MRYFMLNKPKGYLSAARDQRCKTVMELFSGADREGLFHVGRLDKDTEGLLIFTDDGRLCFDLLNPEKIIIGSVYARCEDLLAPYMNQVLEQEALIPSRNVCKVVPPLLQEEIGDKAALAVAMEVYDETRN